jgi:hypothetical protein
MQVDLDRQGRVVAQDGLILGELQPWDIPVRKVRGITCHACHEVIPPKDWNLHKYVCHALGRGRLRSTFQGFTPLTGKSREGMANKEFIQQVLALTK